MYFCTLHLGGKKIIENKFFLVIKPIHMLTLLILHLSAFQQRFFCRLRIRFYFLQVVFCKVLSQEFYWPFRLCSSYLCQSPL